MKNENIENQYTINDLKKSVGVLHSLYAQAEYLKSALDIYIGNLKLKKKLFSVRGKIIDFKRVPNSLKEEMSVPFLDLTSKLKNHFLEKYDCKVCFPILENMRSNPEVDDYPFFQTMYMQVKDDNSSKLILQQLKTKTPIDVNNLKFLKVNAYHLLIPESIKSPARRKVLEDFKKKYPEFDTILYDMIDYRIQNNTKQNLVVRTLEKQFQEYELNDFSPDEVHGKNELTI